MANPFLHILPEVKEALSNNKPVVALESTIIAHGMPYPQNVETAMEVENIIRTNGAVPATVAILNGVCHAGLTQDQIELLGRKKNIWKASLRDLPYVISKKLHGATTVAATMRIASRTGIKIFVTGGIGGVHRQAARTMDISADLTEMAQTSVAVVSAGIKSILDIGLTLEYLETLGVPVVTYGQDEFPAFYSRHSGFDSPLRLDEAAEIAALLQAKWKSGLPGAVLIANPVPVQKEIPYHKMEHYIEKALAAAQEKKIAGKELTPFLLQYLSEHTHGESLETNRALIKNNAALGAAIAAAYMAME
jgi:pseudouridine-5'-phosphate glycosidase